MRARGMMAQRDLYPSLQPARTGRLQLDARHSMYWEQCGRADGVPVLFLHGGPGAGTVPAQRRFFDPTFYRIVLFDQRGAGRSTPTAETIDNTTSHLIADIECLRVHLGIERWVVFGGSWGSTLALAYGLSHPDRCLGFVLRGVFLGRPAEIDWFLHGLKAFFPETWRAFAEALPAEERTDLLANYYRRLVDADPAVHLPAAQAWASYEDACATLRGQRLPERPSRRPALALALARLEAHYLVHGLFIDTEATLARLGVLTHLPAFVVQGRYDMICPNATADALVAAWPGARYRMVEDAGHSAFEPGIRAGLIEATDALCALL